MAMKIKIFLALVLMISSFHAGQWIGWSRPSKYRDMSEGSTSITIENKTAKNYILRLVQISPSIEKYVYDDDTSFKYYFSLYQNQVAFKIPFNLFNANTVPKYMLLFFDVPEGLRPCYEVPDTVMKEKLPRLAGYMYVDIDGRGKQKLVIDEKALIQPMQEKESANASHALP